MSVQASVTGAEWPAREQDVAVSREPQIHLAWFAAGIVLAFFIPYLLTSVIDLQHDIYYLLYFTLVLSFLYLYVRLTGIDVQAVFARNWRWSLAFGVAAWFGQLLLILVA